VASRPDLNRQHDGVAAMRVVPSEGTVAANAALQLDVVVRPRSPGHAMHMLACTIAGGSVLELLVRRRAIVVSLAWYLFARLLFDLTSWVLNKLLSG
jgi:hypothetical protein